MVAGMIKPQGASLHSFFELRVFSSPGLTEQYSSKQKKKNARQLQLGVYRSYEKKT